MRFPETKQLDILIRVMKSSPNSIWRVKENPSRGTGPWAAFSEKFLKFSIMWSLQKSLIIFKNWANRKWYLWLKDILDIRNFSYDGWLLELHLVFHRALGLVCSSQYSSSAGLLGALSSIYKPLKNFQLISMSLKDALLASVECCT